MPRDRITKEYNKRKILAVVERHTDGIITTEVAVQAKLSHSYTFKLLKELKQEGQITNTIVTALRLHNLLWKIGKSEEPVVVKPRSKDKPKRDLPIKQAQLKPRYNPWGQC